MRNAICLMVVALLTLQVSLSGIDIFEDKNNGFEENTDENVNFAGRQSSEGAEIIPLCQIVIS